MNIRYELEKYEPFNEQEQRDKENMIKFIDTFEDVLTRNNTFAHFTSSAWAVNKERTKVLMIYHNIYQSWAWTGGHTDGDNDLLDVAIRELKEETGIENVRVIDENIFSIEIVTVDGHVKRGKYVSSHLHLNTTFLLEVDENEKLKIKDDENSGVKWVDMDKVIEISNETKMKPIYIKEIEKLKKYTK